jgi:uncharacterized protein (PEP-CTERM system associated)
MRGAAGLAAAAVPALVQAQPAGAPSTPGAPRSFGLATGLTFDASVLDVRNRPAGNGTEVVTRASPSLTLAHRGGRLQGTLIYSGSLSARRGIDDREDTDYLNSLSASYLLEAIEGVGFVDARASVSQQTVSAVGVPVGASGSRANRTEVKTVSLSPYLRGMLGGLAEYEARVAGSATRSNEPAANDSNTTLGSLTLRSPRRGALFGWGLSATRQRVEFASSASATTSDRIGLELALQPDVDWRLALTGGQERTDVIGAARREYENYGGSIQWTPSPRTTVLVQGEERYFGRAHRVAIEHRLQRSALRYSDSRDVTSGADGLAAGQGVTLYQVFFALLEAQFPDPVQRDQAVLALIQSLGRNRDEVVPGGLFTTAGITTQRRQELVWTLGGPRLTLSVTGFRLDSERADAGGVNPAGLNDNIAQSGYAGAVGWRLTPLTSLNAAGSRAMSKDTNTLVRTDLKSISLGLASRLGVRTNGALGVRYSVLNGSADSYRETGLTASLSLRF